MLYLERSISHSLGNHGEILCNVLHDFECKVRTSAHNSLGCLETKICRVNQGREGGGRGVEEEEGLEGRGVEEGEGLTEGDVAICLSSPQ